MPLQRFRDLHTGCSAPNEAEELVKRVGAMGWVPKPFDVEELFALIERFC